MFLPPNTGKVIAECFMTRLIRCKNNRCQLALCNKKIICTIFYMFAKARQLSVACSIKRSTSKKKNGI